MATKRGATSELNHDNWDRDEGPEDAGTFKRASEDTIKQRVIKTARRRNPISSVRQNTDDESLDKPNIFGGFTGFKKSSTPTTSAFGFLNTNTSTTKSDPPKTNGTFSTSATPPISSPEKKPQETSTSDSSQQDDYLARLKGLNESVSKWIQKHVESNPFISLAPIFKDYERYFSEIETKYKMQKKVVVSPASSDKKDLGSFVFKTTEKESEKKAPTGFTFTATKPAETETSAPTFSFGIPPKSSAASGFTFNKPEEKKSDLSSFKFGSSVPPTTSTTSPYKFQASSKYTFGIKTTASESVVTTNSTTPTFSFGTNSSTSTFGGSKFSFTPGAAPFTFANTAAPPSENKEPEGHTEEDEEEPPKVEFKAVEEEGHVYKIRCKVFVKKNSQFVDRGVGNLFLKPIEGSGKSQLIVRADTNLGNLLCNFILSEGLPMQRMGKKDVMVVCVPTADAKPPPVPILLRVKSTEEADELLKTLEEYKK